MAFAKHLASVFQPFPSQLSAMAEETIQNELNAPTPEDPTNEENPD